MEQTLEIIETIGVFVAIIFGGVVIWQINSKDSILCRVIQLVLVTVLFTLQIPSLVLKILLNQTSYGITIFLLCIWALNVVVHSSIIVDKMRELNEMRYVNEMRDESSSMEIEAMADIIEWTQEDSKETSDNQ